MTLLIMFDNRKYIVINLSSVTDEMIENALESRDSLRLSLDGSKTILKWDNETPSCFDGITTYSWTEIKEIAGGSDWVLQE